MGLLCPTGCAPAATGVLPPEQSGETWSTGLGERSQGQRKPHIWIIHQKAQYQHSLQRYSVPKFLRLESAEIWKEKDNVKSEDSVPISHIQKSSEIPLLFCSPLTSSQSRKPRSISQEAELLVSEFFSIIYNFFFYKLIFPICSLALYL